jgi:GR25 family glycosyltransferase involved in LPS biosynthesis
MNTTIFKNNNYSKCILNVDAVYVCHYSKLTDRKSYIIDTFSKKFANEYKFIELYNINYIQENITTISSIYPNILKNTKWDRKLTMQEISLALKHIHIIVESFKNEHDSILIFEDDVKLVKDFSKKFNNYKAQLPNDWDILWIGGSHNLHMQYKKPINVYFTEKGSRCNHAYLLSKSCIKKIIHEIYNINMPIDFYFNDLVLVLNINNYWAEPPLAFQNTKFKSSIQNNENILFRFLARIRSSKQFPIPFIKMLYGRYRNCTS